mmetsp:Transcript_90777/g.255911  ORF Transcript_90777/g.255911 Transcript_90777/m.255911 type:complete len:314 (+) Transcript_90777:484-1425(+)
MMPIEHRRVQPRVHALAGATRGEGAATAEEHLEDRHSCKHGAVPATLHLPPEHQVAQWVWPLQPEVAPGVDRLLRWLDRRELLLRLCQAVELREAPRRPLAQVLEADVHAHDDESLGPACSPDVLVQVLNCELGHILLLCIERMAQRVPFVGRHVQELAEETLCVLLQALAHFDRGVACSLDLFLQDRRAQHIGEHEREHDRHIFPQSIELVQNVLAAHSARRGSTELLQGLECAQVAQVRRGAKRHQLQGVGYASALGLLVAAACVDKEPHGRAHPLPVHRRDAHAVRELAKARLRHRHPPRGGGGGARGRR